MITNQGKENMKKELIILLGLCLCIVFFAAAFCIKIPEYELGRIGFIGDYDVKEYVGGDAYNYMIEASLRGGKIAGAMISKTICFAVSGIFLFLTAIYYERNSKAFSKAKENEKLQDSTTNGSEEAEGSASVGETEDNTFAEEAVIEAAEEAELLSEQLKNSDEKTLNIEQ